MNYEKECYCIKNHKNKTTNEEISYSEVFIYEEDIVYHLDLHCFYIFKEDWKYDLLYEVNNFNKYFTTDIKVIRKMKLDKIKKVVQK